MQQTPREEVTCNVEITETRKKVVQLRLLYNSQVSDRLFKEKELDQIQNKLHNILMQLNSQLASRASRGWKRQNSLGSLSESPSEESLQALEENMEQLQQQHSQLQNRLLEIDNENRKM